jgi:DNA repair protein RadC
MNNTPQADLFAPRPMIEAKIIETRVCEPVARAASNPEALAAAWSDHVTSAAWYGDGREHLVAFGMDSRHNITELFLIAVGSLNECTAHPRDIMRPAVIANCYAFALLHNHPSGEPSPSEADRAITRRVRESAELLQIHLLYHVIIGRPHNNSPGYFSFKEHGLL